MDKIENLVFDEERALYNLKNHIIENCTFAGPADGESALKETSNIVVSNSKFLLRYPLWHCNNFKILNSCMENTARAPIWYSNSGDINSCNLFGIKTLRECNNISISKCKISSEEFGWKFNTVNMTDSEIESVYIFFDSKNISLNKVNFKGKYSFQYTENVEITDSTLDTKDAFWHSKNVTVKNSVIKGEYLAWFSENLTFINCNIIGTQPFCYCKNLKLIDCVTEDCDLSFEYSDVDALVKGNIVSVKNPKSGKIVADSIGQIVLENSVYKSEAEIIINNKKDKS